MVGQTFVKSIHIQLSYKRRNISMLEILPVTCEQLYPKQNKCCTHERTLEKSLDGDMTKLSAELDHDIKCCMFGSSSMLLMKSVESGHILELLLLTCKVYV